MSPTTADATPDRDEGRASGAAVGSGSRPCDVVAWLANIAAESVAAAHSLRDLKEAVISL